MLPDPSRIPLNEEQAAEAIGVSRGTLRRWRRTGQGPPFYKLADGPGSAIRYLAGDLARWLASRRKGGNQTA